MDLVANIFIGFSCYTGLPGHGYALMIGYLRHFPFTVVHGRGVYCPLELLSILIRDSSEVRGLRVGQLEEKLSLYVDDAIRYLNDAGPSLLAALSI